jgi:tryptophan 2,3-dioxygenase
MDELDALLHAPSLYDEFVRLCARRGLPVPRELVERDVTQPWVRSSGFV